MYDNFTQDNNNLMKEFRKNYYRMDTNPSFVGSYKWTGKPSDDWNRVDRFVEPSVIQRE